MASVASTLEDIKKSLIQALKHAQNLTELETVRVAFLGRNGKIADLMQHLKSASLEDKRTYGPLCNTLKKFAQQAYEEKKKLFEKEEQQQTTLQQKSFDVTAYKPHRLTSKTHIYSQVIEDLENIFISMGYHIADGPELETDVYNFEALNIAPDHPARDMHDTFWINDTQLLRTPTTTIQIHSLQNNPLPLAVASIGRVFRCEATDASHEFMFTQYEGLFVARNASIAQLIGTLETFLKTFFKQDKLTIRVRPGYFPFVEPGLEIDASCPFCSQKGCPTCKKFGWLELLGAGLVHPNVLSYCEIDSTLYTGFAFGGGVERIAGIKYGINDIRLFHSTKISFLDQF